MIHLKANEYLIREGDPPTCGFLIERGRLEVILERLDGDRILATLGPGEIVGEMALVDQAPRTASVRACEESLLLPITANHIAKRLAASDPVLRLVLGTVLDRYRATLNEIVGLPTNGPTFVKRSLALDTAALAELRIEKELEVGLREGQIRVYYQPITRLADGQLAGFEALARWQHPTRGLIAPNTFVPIAEASGLSAELAVVCLRQVVRDLVALRACAAARPDHLDTPQIAVNISGHDLTTPNLIQQLSEIATSEGGQTSSVTLELTETALIHSPSEAADALACARQLGFNIAVDDFGTGYSSLNYIRTLPVDGFKIDKTFVQGACDCATTRSIVASMLQLADSLGLKVVSEGIETTAQLALMQMLGSEFGQGYLFGRPLPFDKTLDLMSTWRATTVRVPTICAPFV